MGIPAYFRWISEKYPNILVNCVEQASYNATSGTFESGDASKPNPNGVEFDNLYLDMNGIIHPCTHPEDRPVPTNEADMFEAIFDYIDRIFGIVRPRKLVYLAIDGVAPRAKINQQRSRRFRAAREVADRERLEIDLRKEWDKQGLRIQSGGDKDSEGTDSPKKSDKVKNVDPTDYTETPFDSNVITPGTPFMERLAVALRKYVTQRIENDPAWRDITVMFSDASVPGEGEHKIAEFIRRERTHPSYNPNLRHVMYGLDADLIMLALATHEVNFTILREEVFPKNGARRKSSTGPPNTQSQLPSGTDVTQVDSALQAADKTTAPLLQSSLGGRKPFLFLHVNVLREYLDFEFRHDIVNEIAAANKSDVLEYNLERVLDDFVFMCFFVGNDFLPHLPTLDIREGAIEFLMELYKTEFVNTGYLTSSGGDIDFVAVRKLLQKTGEKEDEIFQQRARRERSNQERNERERDERAGNKRLAETDLEQERLPKRRSTGSTDMVTAQPQGKKRRAETDIEQERPRKRQSTGSADATPPEQLVALGQKPSGKIGTVEGRAAANAALNMSFSRGKSSGGQQASNISKPAGKEEVALAEERSAPSEVLKTEAEFKEALQERIRASGEVNAADTVRLGEAGWKQRYYEQKFEWSATHKSQKMTLLRKYFEGLHWVMKYYYVGCISWSWYYPYHYAPFASDLVESDVVAENLKMEEGKPFEPFMQLQAVMPASSGLIVLPSCYSNLMVDPKSPILDYYPEDFAIDLNGKRFAWQGVALLPFIDETRLRAALDPLKDELTDEERTRNSFGECHIMIHRNSLLGKGRRKKVSEDSSELKKVPVDKANGLLFGKTSYPLKQYGGNEGKVLTMRFELPPYAPHESKILASATVVKDVLSEMDKADTRRLGWKAAKFGPLGRAAQELISDRQHRLAMRGRGRGRGTPGGYQPRGQNSWRRGRDSGGSGSAPNNTFEANAAASGMFSAVGARGPHPSSWGHQGTSTWDYQQGSSQYAASFGYPSGDGGYGGYPRQGEQSGHGGYSGYGGYSNHREYTGHSGYSGHGRHSRYEDSSQDHTNGGGTSSGYYSGNYGSQMPYGGFHAHPQPDWSHGQNGYGEPGWDQGNGHYERGGRERQSHREHRGGGRGLSGPTAASWRGWAQSNGYGRRHSDPNRTNSWHQYEQQQNDQPRY